MQLTKWEYIDSCCIARISVPTGWLVSVWDERSSIPDGIIEDYISHLVFVPDPNHEWKVEVDD